MRPHAKLLVWGRACSTSSAGNVCVTGPVGTPCHTQTHRYASEREASQGPSPSARHSRFQAWRSSPGRCGEARLVLTRCPGRAMPLR